MDLLVEKTGNLQIHSINWCDMPPEIKRACIDWMELKERARLRSTSKTEKSLVDSQKLKIHSANFHMNRVLYIGCMSTEIEPELTVDGSKRDDGYSLMQFLFKIGVFEKIEFSLFRQNFQSELFRNLKGPISVKHVDLAGIDEMELFELLDKFTDKVESFSFDAKNWDFDLETLSRINLSEEFPLDRLLSYDKVKNAETLQITHLNSMDSAWKVAQMWLEIDAEIGKTFRVVATRLGTMQAFLEKFADRVVNVPKERIRISTPNPSKHILLEFGHGENNGSDGMLCFLRLMVIPSEMGDSEYEEFEGWMRLLLPMHHFPWDPNYDDEDFIFDDDDDY